MSDGKPHLDFHVPFGAPLDQAPTAFTPDALNLLLGSLLCAIKEITRSRQGGECFLSLK